LRAGNPDRKAFFALEDVLLQRYLKESGISARPATLAEYLTKVVTPTLERHKQGGAVAEENSRQPICAHLPSTGWSAPMAERAYASQSEIQEAPGFFSSATLPPSADGSAWRSISTPRPVPAGISRWWR